MNRLRARIRDAVGASEHSEGSFSARQRHINALNRAGRHLATGKEQLEKNRAGELLAEELRLAQQALGEITGELLPDDLLGEILFQLLYRQVSFFCGLSRFAIDVVQQLNHAHGGGFRQAIVNGLAFPPGFDQPLITQYRQVLRKC